MKRLFVVDLDDTLLARGTIAPDVLKVWQRIVLSGAPVTIATARGLLAATIPLGDAMPQLPIIALNGAVVADYGGGNADVQWIPVELVGPVCRLAEEAGAIPCLLETDGRNDALFVPASTDAFTDWSLNVADYFKTNCIVRDRGPTSDEQARIVRVVLCTTVDAAQHLHRVIENLFPSLGTMFVWSRSQLGKAWLEIGAANATKAHGVSRVASFLQVPLTEVVYYGDATSDLGAMAIVGEAVAVENAETDVLAAADRIIGSAASGAVALDLLERLGKGWTDIH